MDTAAASASIEELARMLDDVRVATLRLKHGLRQRPGDEMLNPPRQLALIHADIEAAIIRLHYAGQLVELNGA